MKQKYDHIVNPNDIKTNFWGQDYKIFLTAQGLSYLVNAENEMTALDEVMDFNIEQGFNGLYAEGPGEFDEYISAGNNGLYFTTDNILIEEV